MSKIKRAIAVLMILFFGAVFFIAYTGKGGTYFTFLDQIPGKDKTGHVFLMFILAFTLSWLLSFRSLRIGSIPVFYGVFWVTIFITVEEFLQLLSPSRKFELLDLACNCAGISFAYLAATMVLVLRSKSLSSRPN